MAFELAEEKKGFQVRTPFIWSSHIYLHRDTTTIDVLEECRWAARIVYVRMVVLHSNSVVRILVIFS